MKYRWLQAINVALMLALMATLAILLAPHHAYSGGNMSVSRTINVAEDAYLDSSDVPPKHYNYGGSTTLTVMSNDKKHIVLRTNLQSIIPTGSNVSDGSLNLYYSNWSGSDPVGRTYYVDRLTETDWVEGSSDGVAEDGAVDWTCRIHGDDPVGVEWTTPGGTYTSTDEAAGTVPSSTGTWMSINVTALMQYAITNGVSADWVIRDPGTPANRSVDFDSSEGTNVPYLSVTFTAPWDSYESDYSTIDDLYDTGGDIIYMKGTGFAAGTYIVRYYDAAGTKVGTDANITIGAGEDLTSHMACNTDEGATAGTWDAKVYLTDGTTVIANDTFTVTSSAIPEFPTVFTAIVVVGLCFCIYYWIRRRQRGESIHDLPIYE